MSSYRITTLGKLLSLFFPLLLTACGSTITEYRKSGFDILQQGFDSISETPHLNEVVELKNVRVHIVGDRRHFNWHVARDFRYGVAGYANSSNEIWIFGKSVNGKIVVNQAILGHELNHLLNFKKPNIENPDELDDLGL